jgi:hypothetical protein
VDPDRVGGTDNTSSPGGTNEGMEEMQPSDQEATHGQEELKIEHLIGGEGEEPLVQNAQVDTSEAVKGKEEESLVQSVQAETSGVAEEDKVDKATDTVSTPVTTPPSGWTTVVDKKNKKAQKNKEKQRKQRAKLLQRQGRDGPLWAQAGGIPPSPSNSITDSPPHNSSDSNQSNESNPSNLTYVPDSQSVPDSPLDQLNDPKSQEEHEDTTKTESSQAGGQQDF